HASAVATAGIVVLMAAAILSLLQRNAVLSARLAPIQSLQAGDRVRPVRATLLGGAAQGGGYDAAGTGTLCALSARCQPCEQMGPGGTEGSGPRREPTRFIGVSPSSREDTERFTARLGVRFPVSLPNDLAGFAKEYKPVALPFTIEIGSG